MLSWAHIGLAGSFGALLMDWLVAVARGLYLARHLFTLYLVVVTEHKCKDVLCVDELTHCWFRHNL